MGVATTFDGGSPRDDLLWTDLKPGRIYRGNNSNAVYLIFEDHHGRESKKTALVVHQTGNESLKWAGPQGGSFTEVFGTITLRFTQND